MLLQYTVSQEDSGSFLKKCVAVIGYGSQGSSQALNLRDSGVSVIVGNRPGASFNAARDAGFSVMPVSEAVSAADVIAVMVPDESAADIYSAEIQPNLRSGQVLLFAHGFNIHYGFITAPPGVDVVMVAPKGVGPMVRKLYLEGSGVPSLVAVAADATGTALSTAIGYAAAIGSARSAILQSTFKDETETDLFGEQSVICGGVPELVRAAYETLIDAGYPPELAYSECAHELKLVVDLIYAGGLSAMHDSVSKTAGYGGITRGSRLINDETRDKMRIMLNEIQSGEFAREWMEEKRQGSPNYRKLVEEVRKSGMEESGKEFRNLIWGNAR